MFPPDSFCSETFSIKNLVSENMQAFFAMSVIILFSKNKRPLLSLHVAIVTDTLALRARARDFSHFAAFLILP